MFNEITKKAIEKAFEKPGQVNANLVDAQQARRVLDRLVGYKISRCCGTRCGAVSPQGAYKR